MLNLHDSYLVENFVRPLSQGLSVEYASVAMLALLVYDIIISMSDEVRYIWRQRWSFGKLLYVLARYSIFLDAITCLLILCLINETSEDCRILYDIITWEIFFGTVLAHWVLMIRTYAIWDRNIFVIAYLLLVQTACIVIGGLKMNESNETMIFLPFAPIIPCAVILSSNGVFVLYCLVLFMELNIVALLLIRGITQWTKSSTLIHTLYRDGVLSFGILFSISLMNIFFTLRSRDSPYFRIIIAPQRVFHSILASRVILNVRKASSKGGFTSKGAATASMHFRERLEESIDFASGVEIVNLE